jgi:hypothetical protein
MENQHAEEPESATTRFTADRLPRPLRRLVAALGVVVAGAAFFATYYWWARSRRPEPEEDQAPQPVSPESGRDDAGSAWRNGHAPPQPAAHDGQGLHLPQRLHAILALRHHGDGEGRRER